MKDTRQSSELVHVLRHSFRPSEQLGVALENFLPPESGRPTTYLQIKSLGMIVLDAYRHASYQYSNELIEARKRVDNSQGQSLEVTPDFQLRQVGEKSVDVLMGVRNKIALSALSQTTKKLLPESLAMRDYADPKYSVFARIHSTVPITPYFQAEAAERYQEAYANLGTKHLLNILPVGITGMDQWLPIARESSEENPLEEAS